MPVIEMIEVLLNGVSKKFGSVLRSRKSGDRTGL